MQSQPFVRISTFGPLEVFARGEAAAGETGRRYVPLSTDRLNGRGTTAAFTLLKVLLCQPHRHAPRDLLMELLWSEHTRKQATARLDDAASVLRSLLRPASGDNLLEYRHSNRNSGNSYQLAPYPLIWVDADAFEWSVVQACRLERFGDDPLPLWEEAYRLASRGAFLADELYSEWAQDRRALLAGHYRQCVHEVTRLYQERGARAEAERVLREHLIREPMDEDGLRPFMELLGKQERYQEALDAYRRSQEALAQEGRALDARTQDIAEYLRTKTIMRTQPARGLSYASLVPQRAMRRHPGTPSISHATQVLLQVEQTDARRSLEQSINQLSSWQETSGAFDGTLDMLCLLVEGEENQEMSLLSRRQLLELGIAAFISRLAQLDSKRISAIEREELGRALGQSIADGWKLFHTAGNTVVLAIGQAQLSLIHQAHALLLPSTRSFLYAGAYGVIGAALHLQERNEEALHAYHHAHLAAVATGDPWYIAQNLICQADTYQALDRPAEALQALEEASGYLGYTDEEHRRTRAHLFGCWADAAMNMGEYTLAQKKLDESVVYLEQMSAKEEFDRGSWLHLVGKYAFETRNYPAAIDYFEQALAALPSDWIIRRILVLLPMMASYACEGDRNACIATANAASSVISVLNAPSMNRGFTNTIQGILKAFPNDAHLQSFILDA